MRFRLYCWGPIQHLSASDSLRSTTNFDEFGDGSRIREGKAGVLLLFGSMTWYIYRRIHLRFTSSFVFLSCAENTFAPDTYQPPRLTMWNTLDIAPTPEKPFTDYTRWRLLVGDAGRQTWHYLQTEEELARWPQTEVERFWLGMKTVRLWSPFLARDSIFVPV